MGSADQHVWSERVVTIGRLHPILATELLTSSVVLAEKYAEDGPPSSPQELIVDLGLAYLGAKYAHMHD